MTETGSYSSACDPHAHDCRGTTAPRRPFEGSLHSRAVIANRPSVATLRAMHWVALDSVPGGHGVAGFPQRLRCGPSGQERLRDRPHPAPPVRSNRDPGAIRTERGLTCGARAQSGADWQRMGRRPGARPSCYHCALHANASNRDEKHAVIALELRNVDILFPPQGLSVRRGRAALQQALSALESGLSRSEIAERTGVILGISNANLTVERGQISVLMGLSGSGKSTLLRAINGLNPVTRGEVLVRDGQTMVDVAHCDAATLRRVRRQRVAMVFQQFALLPWRTVRDNVGFGLELRGEPAEQRKRIIDEQLELVGLSQWADRYCHELSGGMQQRVGLARALATNAEILLMDEPFSALDPLIRNKLQDELLALQERLHKTIVFVSHDLEEALKLGDRVSILEGGRIVQTGTAREIVEHPADDYVSEFVRRVNPNTAFKECNARTAS